jgi:hypothetical protein
MTAWNGQRQEQRATARATGNGNGNGNGKIQGTFAALRMTA